jgi:hypothetical protein
VGDGLEIVITPGSAELSKETLTKMLRNAQKKLIAKQQKEIKDKVVVLSYSIDSLNDYLMELHDKKIALVRELGKANSSNSKEELDKRIQEVNAEIKEINEFIKKALSEKKAYETYLNPEKSTKVNSAAQERFIREQKKYMDKLIDLIGNTAMLEEEHKRRHKIRTKGSREEVKLEEMKDELLKNLGKQRVLNKEIEITNLSMRNTYRTGEVPQKIQKKLEDLQAEQEKLRTEEKFMISQIEKQQAKIMNSLSAAMSGVSLRDNKEKEGKDYYTSRSRPRNESRGSSSRNNNYYRRVVRRDDRDYRRDERDYRRDDRRDERDYRRDDRRDERDYRRDDRRDERDYRRDDRRDERDYRRDDRRDERDYRRDERRDRRGY